MESLLVTVQMLVVEVGVLVEPQGKLQRFPAAGFVHNDLASLKLVFARRTHATTSPNAPAFWRSAASIIGPKERAETFEFFTVKQVIRVPDRHVVSIEQ